MTTPLDPTPDQNRLQSYLDGELSAEARVELARLLETDAALRDEFDRLVELRRVISAVPEAFAAPDPGELAFERVRRSIHDALAPTSPVVAPAAPSVAAPRAAKVTPIRAASRSRRMFFGAMVAVAAAAAVMVVSFGVPSTTDPTASNRTLPSPSVAAARLNGTEIVRVEFGKMSGTYWEQSEGDARVAVVWIDDTFPEEVGRP